VSLQAKVAKMQSVRLLGGVVTGPGRTGLPTADPRGFGRTPGLWNPRTTTSLRQVTMRGGMQGDPGIFGDIGRFIGGAVSSVPVVGGLVGGGITALSNALDPIKQRQSVSTASPQLPPMIGINGMPGAVGFQQSPSGVSVGGLFPGGAKPYAKLDYPPVPYQTGGPAPSGYHWNKADYFLRDGTFIAKGTKLVKNRRRNPANSRATNRAISRVASAKKHASNLSRVTIRKKSSCK